MSAASHASLVPSESSPRPAQRASCIADCEHCGLPVPAGLIETGLPRQFCCHGCRTAYRVLTEFGLERFYELRADSDAAAAPARSTGRRYAEFDDPAFQRLYCRDLPGGLRSTELFLEGVHCAACVWLVEKLPRIQAGVREVSLNLGSALVRVVWDPAAATLSDIARGLDSIGYAAHPARDGAARETRRRDERTFLSRIAVAGACAGNAMLLALALYCGILGDLQTEFERFLRWLSMGIGLISLAWPGSLFFRGAWAAVRTRTPHLDLPIAVGLAAGAISGVVCTWMGIGDVYFDSLSVLVFLLLVGRWIQYRQQRGAADALELLFALTPTSALIVEGDELREAAIEAVTPGTLVEVRAGDSVPADGVVELGESRIDASLLTGESRPIPVRPGDGVHAGTVNLVSPIRVRVSRSGASTRIGQLMQLVQESARRRPAVVRFADRIAGWFVAVVLVLAAVTLVAWIPAGAAAALSHVTALLIVTCPCALGLATPLAVSVAIGRAARQRILIKGGDALEHLAGTGILLLDKTGTLTTGRTRVVRWHGATLARTLAASLEKHSNHPIARALANDSSLSEASHPVTDVVQTIGAGIEGIVAGRRVRVGSRSYVSAESARIPDWLDDFETDVMTEGLTPVRIAVDGDVVGCAGVGDGLRPDGPAAVDGLRSLHWSVRILSGDRPELVSAVARGMCVDPSHAHGGVTPEGKLAAVQALRSTGPVVMVGDGVNDAAALSAATVGIAVHGGAEASLAAADIFLNRPGLTPLVELVYAARGLMRTIHRCLAISLFYNAVAAGLAMAGLITPLIAAILMPISSFTVIGLAFSQGSFRGLASDLAKEKR